MGDSFSGSRSIGDLPDPVGDHIYCPQPPNPFDVAASLGGTRCFRTAIWTRDVVHLSLDKAGPCCLWLENETRSWQVKIRTFGLT